MVSVILTAGQQGQQRRQTRGSPSGDPHYSFCEQVYFFFSEVCLFLGGIVWCFIPFNLKEFLQPLAGQTHHTSMGAKRGARTRALEGLPWSCLTFFWDTVC